MENYEMEKDILNLYLRSELLKQGRSLDFDVYEEEPRELILMLTAENIGAYITKCFKFDADDEIALYDMLYDTSNSKNPEYICDNFENLLEKLERFELLPIDIAAIRNLVKNYKKHN